MEDDQAQTVFFDEIGEDLGKLSSDLSEWEVIERLLPSGWQDAARTCGAMKRTGGSITSASLLLRVLLIHLLDGCSLRETAVRARQGGLVDVSDVALLKRLRRCGAWFGWMTQAMIERLATTHRPVLPGRAVKLIDASVVSEPGATGSTWRLHYALDLSTVQCEQAHVTPISVGEGLSRFEVKAGDVLMADRGLASRAGIRHVLDHGGDVVLRMSAMPLEHPGQEGKSLDLLPRLRRLRVGQPQGWLAQVRDDRGVIPVQVCALKKSAQQRRLSVETLQRTAKRKGRTLRARTIELAGYVMVVSTLCDEDPGRLLELYRHRWQIELAFKRLKSLLQLGHLKKTDPQGAKAWLQGKVFVSTLIESLLVVGERFSPWGYFLPEPERTVSMSLARDRAYASLAAAGDHPRLVAAS
jgi:Transposase DDE domain